MKKKSKTPTLDLHGKFHYSVTNDIIRFIEANWDSGKTIHIITGNSNKMKEIVINVIKEYKLDFEIGDPFNHGYIKLYT